jgi:ribosomal protein S18 acetylase RimI-like enzyme
MASGVSIEILDLRHFASPVLHPVLEAEGKIWKQRLHWDYQTSTKLLMQYLDTHTLPGYAALEAGQVTGYAFCVYEGSKAVIGDVFALPNPRASGEPAHEIEEALLRHLLELLVNSPQIDRVESQLLMHPSGFHTKAFRQSGFQVYPRLFMVRPLQEFFTAPHTDLSGGVELRPWNDNDLTPAARLIALSYSGHPDSVVNDQYRTVYGAMRFLNNIVHHAGCGTFSAQASHVVVDHVSQKMVAMILSSRVSLESGHITQLCVHPEFRRSGLARMLLDLAISDFLRQSVTEVSLTVTASNSEAVALYRAEGFDCAHTFDATVWERNRIA